MQKPTKRRINVHKATKHHKKGHNSTFYDKTGTGIRCGLSTFVAYEHDTSSQQQHNHFPLGSDL